MYENTNRLKLPLLVPNQSGKEFTHNEAMVIIDNLLQNHVISKTLSVPAIEPTTGDMYIVANNGTEYWLNKDNQLAIFDNGWRFVEPINGMIFYVLDENCFYVYKDNWIKLATLIDFTQLHNVVINNLQENDIIKYNGNNFVNTRELNLLRLCVNNKLLIDENLNINIKNNEELTDIVSITENEIDFKTNIKIFGIVIDDYIINMINTKENNFVKKDLSNLTGEARESIKNMVGESVLNSDCDNITETGLKTIQNYLTPDYDSAIDIAASLIDGYTAPANGVVILSLLNIGNGNNDINLYINDILIINNFEHPGNPSLSGTFIVKKGDVVKVIASGYALSTTLHNIFCPFRTETNTGNNNNQGK